MKNYYYEINGYIKGVTEAKNIFDARRHCKKLASIFCPNTIIRTTKIQRIKNNKPLAIEQ